MNGKWICRRFLVFLPLTGLFVPTVRPQQMSSFDRDRALLMLEDVAKDVQKHYYDQDFHGVDWDATVLEAKRKIKAETSLNLALAHIAAALVSLNDSHTFFLPPPRSYVHDYGFQMDMIGSQLRSPAPPPCWASRSLPRTPARCSPTSGRQSSREKNSGPLHNSFTRSDPISREYLLAAALAWKKITARPR